MVEQDSGYVVLFIGITDHLHAIYRTTFEIRESTSDFGKVIQPHE